MHERAASGGASAPPSAGPRAGGSSAAGSGEIAPPYDYVLVGGGLANGLIALAVWAAQPRARIALLERGAELGGNHTWCFHAGDVPARARPWVDALVAHRWPGYDVAFPGFRRQLPSPYAAVTSESLSRAVRGAFARAPGSRLALGCEVKQVREHEAVLADGERVRGQRVVDARGPEQSGEANPPGGFQKFVGLEVVLRAAHGRTQPMLMDATVEQIEGFRFVYVLPLDERRLLIEDTYVTDRPQLDRPALEARVRAYAETQGWEIQDVARVESGVLPLPLSGAPAPLERGPLVAGYQGGWFHPVTGYSFPASLRLALCLANPPPHASPGEALARLRRAVAGQRRYGQWLNHMFFRWYPPAQRYHVLARFYRLPEPTVRRFYAMELTLGDRARILIGRPPRGLSLRRALRGGAGA